MERTANYDLSKWEKTDRIEMEDFNEDNRKIDAALAGLSETVTEHTAALATLGNCRVWTTSYTGVGKYGSSNAVSCTFPEMPLLFFVFGGNGAGIFWSNCTTGLSLFTTIYNLPVSWTGNMVKWSDNTTASLMFNSSGVTYHILALLPPKD